MSCNRLKRRFNKVKYPRLAIAGHVIFFYFQLLPTLNQPTHRREMYELSNTVGINAERSSESHRINGVSELTRVLIHAACSHYPQPHRVPLQLPRER